MGSTETDSFLRIRFRYQTVGSLVPSFIGEVRFKGINLRKAMHSQSMTEVSIKNTGLYVFAY
jgi:hypothetical protein